MLKRSFVAVIYNVTGGEIFLEGEMRKRIHPIGSFHKQAVLGFDGFEYRFRVCAEEIVVHIGQVLDKILDECF